MDEPPKSADEVRLEIPTGTGIILERPRVVT